LAKAEAGHLHEADFVSASGELCGRCWNVWASHNPVKHIVAGVCEGRTKAWRKIEAEHPPQLGCCR
jgi:hypothetical protein